MATLTKVRPGYYRSEGGKVLAIRVGSKDKPWVVIRNKSVFETKRRLVGSLADAFKIARRMA